MSPFGAGFPVAQRVFAPASRPVPVNVATATMAVTRVASTGLDQGAMTITYDPATDGCPAPPFDGGGHGEPAPAAVVLAPRFTG